MDLSYPVGKFDWQKPVDPSARPAFIAILAAAPRNLRAAVVGLNDTQLDTPYRPDGWTVRQVVHHVADSHMNCYIRVKFALTETEPPVRPYDEAVWARLHDALTLPVEPSLQLIEGLHTRWVDLMETLPDSGFSKGFIHPDNGRMTIDTTLALYAWHSRHHTAHITGLRQRMDWK